MFEDAIKESRKEWTTTTYADGFGNWHAVVSSPIGWGNAGTHDIGYHINAIKARAKRAINRELAIREGWEEGHKKVGVEVYACTPNSFNVIHKIDYVEKDLTSGRKSR